MTLSNSSSRALRGGGVGHGDPGVVEGAGQLGRHLGDPGLERGHRHIFRVQEYLVQRDRRVHHGVVCRQEGDRARGFRRLEIERRLDRIGRSGRWLGPHHLVDVGDVVDLVHARPDALVGVHPSRYVPGDGHPQPVGLGGDGGHDLRLDAAVDLHLLEPGGVVPLDHGHRLLRRVGPVDTDGVGRVAVDDAGQQEPRPHPAPRGDRVAHPGDEFELVADIPRRGHTGGEVDGPPLDLFVVRVHVPEPGQDALAPGVDHRHSLGHLDARARRRDPTLLDDHHRVRHRRAAVAVDQGAADQGEVARRAGIRAAGQLSQRLGGIGRGPRHEQRQRRLVVVPDRLEVIELGVDRDGRGQALIGIEPEGLPAPDQSGDAVPGQDLLPAARGHRVDAAAR